MGNTQHSTRADVCSNTFRNRLRHSTSSKLTNALRRQSGRVNKNAHFGFDEICKSDFTAGEVGEIGTIGTREVPLDNQYESILMTVIKHH